MTDQMERRQKDSCYTRLPREKDMKIVCACHASFLTPAEFVKHGGGGDIDVENPLKHINIILDY